MAGVSGMLCDLCREDAEREEQEQHEHESGANVGEGAMGDTVATADEDPERDAREQEAPPLGTSSAPTKVPTRAKKQALCRIELSKTVSCTHRNPTPTLTLTRNSFPLTPDAFDKEVDPV